MSGRQPPGSVRARSARPLVAVLAIALSGTAAEASEYVGMVSGAGVPIPGATVVATRGEQVVLTTSDAAGMFRFGDLDDGAWSIRVEMLGFTPVSRDVAVGASVEPVTWTLTLRPVAVVASARAADVGAGGHPGSPPPRSAETASVSAADRGGELAPSTTSGPQDVFGAADGYLVNGSVNNAAASPFAQMAAFGNNRRGVRSLYSGGLGLQVGNSAWDARPFSFGAVPSPKPSYGDAQVLVTFGGPVRIPKWFRNAPTVFLGYQRTDDHNLTARSGLVPTLAERAGDFSQSFDAGGRPLAPVDPGTGEPFSGRVIPASRLSPQALALLDYYPLPNLEGGRNNYQTTVVVARQQDAAQSRVMHALNGRNQLFGTVTAQRTTTETGSLFGFTDASRNSTFEVAANWTHRFSQMLTTRLQYQYTRQSSSVTPFFAGRTNVSGEAGIDGNDQDPENWGPPALTFRSGLAGFGGAQFGSTRSGTHAIGAELMRAIPRHTLTIGGDVRPDHVSVVSQQDARGTFSFTGAATGSDLADFLLGIPATSSIGFGNADKQLRATNADLYVNDDWRVSPTLTVNAGVRWEYEAPFVEARNRLADLDVAAGFLAASPVAATDPRGAITGRHYPRSLLQADRSGVQPRIGAAWRPVAGSSLVLRAGYGIYRNTKVYQPLALLLAGQPPFATAASVANSPALGLTLAHGFPSRAAAASTFAIDPDFRVASVQNWQVAAQRDLPGSLTLVGTYAGSKGSHLMQEFLPNTYPAGAANPCPACPVGFVYLTSGGSSLRNAGQLQIRRRLRNGLTGTVQYTFAKATDNAAAFLRADDGLQTAAGSGFVAQDWRNPDADQGPSNFDQRHQLSLQVQFTTGMGTGGGALASGTRGRLLNGWTLTAQLDAASGLPQTPTYLATIAGTGVTGTVRASLTGIPIGDVPAGFYANPAAYAPPQTGEWGTAGRNSITGPAQFSLNGGVSRAFLLNSRVTLDCRVDATNLLNRVTYASIDTVVGSPQFGLPVQANPMRRILTSARLRF